VASDRLERLYGLDGRVAVVTGGTGVLGRSLVRGLLDAGANVALLGRSQERLDETARLMDAPGRVLLLQADVADEDAVERARARVVDEWGAAHVLLNGAGGNLKEATLQPGQSPFELSVEGFRSALELNLLGTLVPTRVFGPLLADSARESDACIVNVSSMAALRPLTRVPAYGAAKAGIDNFTRWLAVEVARTISPRLRVNAIAPGFLLAEQNRALLYDGDTLTPRGRKIVDGTPAGRFGEAEELVSTLLWLCGPGASFVNGVVVPVDGGFDAYSGV
jgi:NAD(P)-dependent dehydrogenase (short-subunit alcohol dehydrogenase family)